MLKKFFNTEIGWGDELGVFRCSCHLYPNFNLNSFGETMIENKRKAITMSESVGILMIGTSKGSYNGQCPLFW